MKFDTLNTRWQNNAGAEHLTCSSAFSTDHFKHTGWIFFFFSFHGSCQWWHKNYLHTLQALHTHAVSLPWKTERRHHSDLSHPTPLPPASAPAPPAPRGPAPAAAAAAALRVPHLRSGCGRGRWAVRSAPEAKPYRPQGAARLSWKRTKSEWRISAEVQIKERDLSFRLVKEYNTHRNNTRALYTQTQK